MASKFKGWLPKPTWKAVQKQRGPVRVLERGRAWLQQLEVSISGVSFCLFLVNLSSRYMQSVGIDGFQTPNWILEHIHLFGCQNASPLFWHFIEAGSWCAEPVTDCIFSLQGEFLSAEGASAPFWLSLFQPYPHGFYVYILIFLQIM